MNGRRLLVTGGAGFIGSAFIRYGMQKMPWCLQILNLDQLTYAADLTLLSEIEADPRYFFIQGDIRDEILVERLCREYKIDTIVHFAAESHVDRSIAGPRVFYETNVGGTLALLEVVRRCPWIHFHHISTDEVFGTLGDQGVFDEFSPYRPNSPYAASKAAADHFVRAYGHTYGLSTTLSHCTNNYGPGQNEEKLIPLMISCCMQKKPLPVYGTGNNVRDWIFVEDHVEALWRIVQQKRSGEVYAIGAECEKKNIEVVQAIIEAFALLTGEESSRYHALITSVPDRKGHDWRYAIDTSKVRNELNWAPMHDFTTGIKKTVEWYTQEPSKIGF